MPAGFFDADNVTRLSLYVSLTIASYSSLGMALGLSLIGNGNGDEYGYGDGPSALHAGRSTGAAPRGSLHEGRSTGRSQIFFILTCAQY